MDACLRDFIVISLEPCIAVMTRIDIEYVKAGVYPRANDDERGPSGGVPDARCPPFDFDDFFWPRRAPHAFKREISLTRRIGHLHPVR